VIQRAPAAWQANVCDAALEPSGAITPIVDGLDYPASITFGPDGDLYVTNNGFSLTSNGDGTILRIRIRG